MTFPVVVAPDAKGDLIRLNAFLSEKSPKAADRAMSAIQSGLRSLASLPNRTPEWEGGKRALVIRFGDSGYIVQYRFDGHTVVVVRIVHMREDRD